MTRFRTQAALFSILATAPGAAALADTPPGALFDSPWIGYDTGVYPEALWPFASDVADFNGDGAPDLAAVSWGGTPYLSILLGDGEGRYFPPTLYRLDLESMDIVARDFDNDGDVDLAIAETGRFWEGLFVSLWRNDGEGGFARVGLFSTGDDGPSGITAADFNRDGFMDVAVAHDSYIVRDNTVSVLLNNRNGGFQSPRVIFIASGTNDLDSGDINGDGDADIVVAHEGNFWSIVENEDGQFFPAGNITGIDSGSIPENPVVTMGDVDLDGDLDVLFSNQDTGGFGNGAIGLWRNDGSGNFGTGEKISLITPLDNDVPGGTDIDVVDVTHDAWPDLLVGNGYWYVIPGDGEGGFVPPRLYHAGESVADLEATDLDDDGDLDVLALCSGSVDVCVYLNPGAADFTQPPVIPILDPQFAPGFPIRLSVDDIDDDGDLDLVTGFRADFEERHGLSLRRNNGDGTFGPIVEMLEATYPLDLVLRDMNGDGEEDMLYILSTGRFYLRLNDGNGNFTTRLPRHAFSGQINQVDAVDVDNDDDLDVLVDTGFSIGISVNLGNNNYAAPIYHEVDDFFGSFGHGDFNNDDNVDLLTDSGLQGYPQISLGNGDGTFQSPQTVPTGRDVHAFAAGHLDDDGNLDMATYYNLDEKGLGVRRGRGTGSFFPTFLAPGAYWRGDHTGTLDLSDIDDDGNLDAMTGSFGGQDFSFWRGLGDGTFEDDVRYGVAWHVHDIQPGDFDGDGLLDMAAICRIDNGRWWYPGVVIIKGKRDALEQVASLTDFAILDGTLISGGLPEIEHSDDAYLTIEARVTGEVHQPHLLRVLIGAETAVDTAESMRLKVESRITDVEASAWLFLRNWNTNQMVQVDAFMVTMQESVHEIEVPNAGRFVRNSDGRIELEIKEIVFFPFTLNGFHALFDHVEIGVR